MIKNELYAYSAGIIDSEGSILLTYKDKKSRFRHPVMSVTSTTIEILLFLQQLFGGNIVKQKRYKDGHKLSYIWSVSYDKALNCLDKIYPYLLVKEKRFRANHILTYYKKVTKRNGKYNAKELALKYKFEDCFYHNAPFIIDKI